jgi:hypothetical protein
MSAVSKYIVDGRVQREDIAMDIKNGKLSQSDLDEILADETIQAAYIGSDFTDETSQSQWNRAYLDKLSYAVVSEAFNRAYLSYLFKVSSYVHEKENIGKRTIPRATASIRSNRIPVHGSRTKRKGCMIPLLIILGIGVVIFISLTRG